MNAGQIIAQTLKLYDTQCFFAFTGADQEIWLGLRDAGIRYILPHSERVNTKATAPRSIFPAYVNSARARFTAAPSSQLKI